MFTSVREFQEMDVYQRITRINEYFMTRDIQLSWKHKRLMEFIEPYRSMIYGSTRAYIYNLEKLNDVMKQIHFFGILVYTGYQSQGQFVGMYEETTLLHYRPEMIMKIVEHDIAYNYSSANILRLPIEFIASQKCADICSKRRRIIQNKMLKLTLLRNVSTFCKYSNIYENPQCRYENYIVQIIRGLAMSHDDPIVIDSMNEIHEQLKTNAMLIISKRIVHLPIYERAMKRRYHPSSGYIEESMKEFDFIS
ncbi:hypothetical protein EPVG_00447 [Emiliania huxleyi virus 201]|nr:hypothetical protein ELVG_00431 [Emiliania huxleyi virus 203]AEP15793.1 hypothetical protein EQVG_00384 [Emiliania huxleyi virus 207]AEP16204.1 hypothetical protein ERVG_00329 [Emiliania huxleyi virus 208]AET98334.1 hypothetical protein EPVG_00447 [Emiliania huxleyi virus 201]